MNNFDPAMINKIQTLIAQNPQLAPLLQKPGLVQKLQQMASHPNDPSVAQQVSSDPDIQQVMSILRSAQGGDSAFPNAFGGGGGGGMGGMGGGGFGNQGGFNNFGNNMNNSNGVNNNQGGGGGGGDSGGSDGKNMIYISSSTQFNDIIQNTKNKLIACDFYATWCGPCKVISPEFDRLAKFYKNKAIFLKIDVDRTKDISRACGVRAMPTFQFYKNGVKIDEFKGANTQKLSQLLETHTYVVPKIRTLPYSYFPIKEDNRPVFAKMPPFAKVLSKIEGTNKDINDSNGGCKLNENDLKVLKEVCDYLGAKSQWMSQTFTDKHFQVLSKALDWSSKDVTLILDLLRVLVLHPSVVDYFKIESNFEFIEKIFKNHGKNFKTTKHNATLACRIVINMFNKTGLKAVLQSKIAVIGNGLIACMESEDVKVRLAFIKVLTQCAFLLYSVQDKLIRTNEANDNNERLKELNNGQIVKIIALKIRCFSMLAEVLSIENDVQNILACLMSLGTLLFRDENVVAFAKSIEFKMVLKQCNKRFGIETSNNNSNSNEIDEKDDNSSNSTQAKPTPDIAKCIAELIKAIDNPKD